MCTCNNVDYLPLLAFLQDDLLPPSCHDSTCPFKLPVKHRTILLPEAPVYLFEQDQGAGGIQMGASERIYAKKQIYCVFCRLDDGHVSVICQQRR